MLAADCRWYDHRGSQQMIGRTVSHYRILGKLGSGGMGDVYLAEDLELERRVALKVLPEQVSGDPERLDRFRREAKTLAALNHPNIVTIHSVEAADGLHFLTMELVEGTTLAQRIPRGGMELNQLLDTAAALTDALTEAHAKGVVHRDLKPGNIMLTEADSVKVLDFGLAKLLADPAGGEATQLPTEPLTAEGHIVGTLPYMSPEQLENQPLDARSDIFSLGAVLYEMAVGRRPFEGSTSVSLISSIVKDTPGDVDTVRDDLPHHLARIIRQCLEKRPEDRFQTARDVRNQLEHLRRESGSAITSAPTTVAPVAHSRPRMALAVAVVAALGLVGYLAWFGGRSAQPTSGESDRATVVSPKIVVLPFENLGAPEDEYFADGMSEEITSRLASLSGLSVISRTTAMRYKSTRPSLEQIREELDIDYLLEGTVRWQKAADGSSQVRITPQLISAADDTQLWSESYDAVLANIFQVQSDVARRVSEQLDIALLAPQLAALEARPTDNLEAYDFYLRGNERLARGRELTSSDQTREAIAYYEAAIELDPGFAASHARLGWAHLDIYQRYTDRSDERLVQARMAIDLALGLDPHLPDAHLALGTYYLEGFRDYEQALAEFRAVQLQQPNNGHVHELLAEAQENLGDWEGSLASLEKAWELNPRLGRLPCSAGGACIALRDFERARELHQHAIQLSPDRACPLFCVGWIYLGWDPTSERARDFLSSLPPRVDPEATPPINYIRFLAELFDSEFEEALAHLTAGTTEAYEFHFFYIPKTLLRAQVYELTGRPEQARLHFEAARQLLEARLVERPQDDRFKGSLAIALAGLGDAERAVREAEEAFDLVSDSYHKRRGFRLRDLALTYTMTGQYDLALEHLETLLSMPSFFSANMLSRDPSWRPLHGLAGFEELMRGHGATGPIA